MGGIASPYPLNNPVLGKMLQERSMAQQQPQAPSAPAAPGPSSTPDAMNEGPAPIRVEHDIAGFAPQPVAPQKALAGKVQPIQPSGNEQALQTKYNDLSTHGSGISQLGGEHPGVGAKIGKGLLTALDAVGSGLFPRIAMNIPGTEAHHRLLLGETQQGLEHEQKNRLQTNQEQEQAARATDLESKPELAESANEVRRLTSENRLQAEQGKTAERSAYHEGELGARSQAQEINDRKAGYRRNADGELEVIPPEEMTPQEQENYELRSAQTELAHANAAYKRAQALPGDTAAQKLQAERIANTTKRLQFMGRTADRMDRQFEMRAHGTEGGVPLPGSLLTDENKPVGTAFQQNVRPTGTERTRADLATSAHEQLNDMRDVIKRHPEFFGPGAGRKTQFVTWIGSQDPDAQKFLTARSILADHATGVFGARSEAAINAQKIAAGELKDNPDAILAGLNQIEKAIGTIKGRGVVKTTGSKDAKDATSGDTLPGGVSLADIDAEIARRKKK